MASQSALLVIISGPSGAGKDSVVSGLKQLGKPWHFPVTATTRPPRGAEVDGVDYIFMGESQFDELLAQGGFLEYAEVYGTGTACHGNRCRMRWRGGRRWQLKVDVQGTATIKGLAPDAVAIMVEPASVEELRGRLMRRGTEVGPELERRLAAAVLEMGETGSVRLPGAERRRQAGRGRCLRRGHH